MVTSKKNKSTIKELSIIFLIVVFLGVIFTYLGNASATTKNNNNAFTSQKSIKQFELKLKKEFVKQKGANNLIKQAVYNNYITQTDAITIIEYNRFLPQDHPDNKKAMDFIVKLYREFLEIGFTEEQIFRLEVNQMLMLNQLINP